MPESMAGHASNHISNVHIRVYVRIYVLFGDWCSNIDARMLDDGHGPSVSRLEAVGYLAPAPAAGAQEGKYLSLDDRRDGGFLYCMQARCCCG